jgi:hypothetical protein
MIAFGRCQRGFVPEQGLEISLPAQFGAGRVLLPPLTKLPSLMFRFVMISMFFALSPDLVPMEASGASSLA